MCSPDFGASPVFGRYGDQWEVRAGENWYLMKERGIRLNGEWMHVNRSPVGYTAYRMWDQARRAPRLGCPALSPDNRLAAPRCHRHSSAPPQG
jgi:hypothetical protein